VLDPRRLTTALAGLVVSSVAGAQALHTTRVGYGLDRPTSVVAPPGDPHRLFATEQWTGLVRVVRNGELLPTPFVDAGPVSTGIEQGLLGLAFHPAYETNGLVYVHLTDASGTSVVREFRRDANVLERADPASARTLLVVPQPFPNHNGGALAFGPDGYLYVALGDGGSFNDSANNAQNLDVLLGKILRLDVNGDDFPADPLRNYAIPPTNPFAGAIPGADEVLHYGLRNPWRCTFDRVTGHLFIGDVGEGLREEVDVALAGTTGLNFGWRCMEGLACTGLSGCVCNAASLTLPIHQYGHAMGCSIIGGHVYRGAAIPSLAGTYFFADYCSNRIWSFAVSATGVPGPVVERTQELAPIGGPSITNVFTFGEDGRGELLIVEQDGEIWRVDGPAPGTAVCFGDGSGPTDCPCNNPGAPGRGCANSYEPAGGWLDAMGTTSPDTLRLSVEGLPPTSVGLFLSGDAFDATGTPFGDGIFCLSGTLRRLRARTAVGGVAHDPEPGELPISARSQAIPGSGTSQWFQVYYRNAAPFCTPDTFNTSSGYRVVW